MLLSVMQKVYLLQFITSPLMCVHKWHFSQCIGPWGPRKSRCLRLQKIQIWWTWIEWKCQTAKPQWRRNRPNSHCHPVTDLFFYNYLQFFSFFLFFTVMFLFHRWLLASQVSLGRWSSLRPFTEVQELWNINAYFLLFYAFVCKCIYSIYRVINQKWPVVYLVLPFMA